MSALGRDLDEGQGDLPVPACPEWTVREVFAHQAGVATDLLAGRFEGAGTDEWTARQVVERRGRPLDTLLDEWDAAAPALVDTLADFGDDIDPRLLMDLWHHHQDVLGAVGRRGERSGDLADWVLARCHDRVANVVGEHGLEVVLGPAPAEPTPGALTVEPYELARGLLGRRSLGQIRDWSWGVDDPGDVVAAIPVFGPRPEPLLEPEP